MFKFVFFDEDPSYFSELSDYFDHEEKVGTVCHYSDFNLLLNNLADQNIIPDAVFLALKQENKTETLQRAESIYLANRFVPVIYVSNRDSTWDQTILLPMTNLVGYLTLPLVNDVVQEYLEKLADLKRSSQLLTIKIRGKENYISSNSILFIESRKHLADIHTDSGVFSTYEKLSDILTRLPDNFIQIHKSYLINAERISRADQKTIELDSGESVTISRSNRKVVIEKLKRLGYMK